MTTLAKNTHPNLLFSQDEAVECNGDDGVFSVKDDAQDCLMRSPTIMMSKANHIIVISEIIKTINSIILLLTLKMAYADNLFEEKVTYFSAIRHNLQPSLEDFISKGCVNSKYIKSSLIDIDFIVENKKNIKVTLYNRSHQIVRLSSPIFNRDNFFELMTNSERTGITGRLTFKQIIYEQNKKLLSIKENYDIRKNYKIIEKNEEITLQPKEQFDFIKNGESDIHFSFIQNYDMPISWKLSFELKILNDKEISHNICYSRIYYNLL